MSSLIHAYSSYLGTIPKNEKPVLQEHIFPLPFERYIVFHNDNALPSKHYDYMPEVIALLKPILKGYAFVQIGGPKDPHIEGVDVHYAGLTWNQSAYVISKCDLFIGQDSAPAHIVSMYDRKAVVLYSHIYEQQSPLNWSSPENVRTLSPDFSAKKPSYAAQENPKRNKEIGVEKICNAAFELLGAGTKLNFQTLRIGDTFHERVVEVIPDFVINDDSLKGGLIHMRLDKVFDPQCMKLWLQRGHNVNVVTKKKVDFALLQEFRQHIKQVTLFARDVDSFDLDYVKSVKSLGCGLVVVTDNDEILSPLRLKFFDYQVERLHNPDRSIVDSIPKDAKFWTKKLVFSKGKAYPSTSHWQKKDQNPQKIIDTPEFWRDIEFYYIYQ